MKNTMLFCGAALMSIAMLQSCTKDELSNVNAVSGPQDMTFVAGTPSSRSSLQNGTTVWWTTGDAINIFSGQENNKFTTATGGSTVTTCTGKATPNNSYTALYPYNAEAVCLEGVVTTTLPSEQTAPAWGFDANANISYATATDNNKSLTFQNTCGLVKFKNNLTDLTGIKLTAGGDVKIAGNVKIDASANLTVESGSNVITLTAKEGTFVGPNEQNKNAKEYSMVVAPVTFTDGFTLELTRNSGTKTYNFSGENLIVTKGQIVTIVLNDDQGGGEPPVDLEKQTTVAVSSAKEIVPDQTTGNDRIELTLDKEVAGTFTDAVNKAFTITVAGKTIPVASGSVNGTTMTLILGDKIYSNDANISVSYNTDYAVSALTAKNENNEDANIEIESANVALTHADAFDFNFANIDAVNEYLAEGVAEKINASGELEIVPADNQFPVTKSMSFRDGCTYKFTYTYASNDCATTFRLGASDKYKFWIGRNTGSGTYTNTFTISSSTSAETPASRADGSLVWPVLENVILTVQTNVPGGTDATGTAKITSFKIEEITERPSTGADASFDSTTEGFNNGAEWTPNK